MCVCARPAPRGGATALRHATPRLRASRQRACSARCSCSLWRKQPAEDVDILFIFRPPPRPRARAAFLSSEPTRRGSRPRPCCRPRHGGVQEHTLAAERLNTC
jgi:hypothetical protein